MSTNSTYKTRKSGAEGRSVSIALKETRRAKYASTVIPARWAF